MNAQWNVQEAVESLRNEVREGFDRVSDKQSELDNRLTAVETAGKGLWAVLISLIAAAFGWAFSK